MRRGEWSLRSSLWFVFLVALGLKAITGTWDNLKRGSVEYHRGMGYRCERRSKFYLHAAAEIEDELKSQPIKDPAIAAEQRRWAMDLAQSARSDSLLAASLEAKAELCEKSSLEWIFLVYETSRNPPDLPVHHVSGQSHRPWAKGSPLDAFFRHPAINAIMKTLEYVDYFGLACLILAIVGKNRSARAKVILGVRGTWCHVRFWLTRRIW